MVGEEAVILDHRIMPDISAATEDDAFADHHVGLHVVIVEHEDIGAHLQVFPT